jgi:hypothetical protein
VIVPVYTMWMRATMHTLILWYYQPTVALLSVATYSTSSAVGTLSPLALLTQLFQHRFTPRHTMSMSHVPWLAAEGMDIFHYVLHYWRFKNDDATTIGRQMCGRGLEWWLLQCPNRER